MKLMKDTIRYKSKDSFPLFFAGQHLLVFNYKVNKVGLKNF